MSVKVWPINRHIVTLRTFEHLLLILAFEDMACEAPLFFKGNVTVTALKLKYL